MKNLRNITINDFRRILIELGCCKNRVKGGHEVWKKKGLLRPIIFQTHEEPIPEMVIRNAIRDLNISRNEFMMVYEKI